jgi:hypothetical protein
MQLKNILHLAKNIKEYNLFKLIKKNNFKIEEIHTKNKSLEKDIEKVNSLLSSIIEENKSLREENEKIKKTCVNLSHDMLLISKAIGQIYMLTEKAIIEGTLGFDEIFCDASIDVDKKKKKEEYH